MSAKNRKKIQPLASRLSWMRTWEKIAILRVSVEKSK